MGKILKQGDLQGKKVISRKVGPSAKSGHVDHMSMSASSHSSMKVPKGTNKFQGPATNC